MPESFYGGKSGRSFEITAKFKNKLELDNDMNKRFNSEIPMNSFVAISYGRKNTEEYELNKRIDQNAYGEQFDSTLWYKVYSETQISNPFDDSKRYGVQYVLIYDFAGQTPNISFTDTDLLNPIDDPFIDIFNIDDSNYPILQAHLPRAVNWYTGLELSERLENLELPNNSIIYYIGDLYLNKYNGNLYKCIQKTANRVSRWNYVGNILGPTLEVNAVSTSTLGPLQEANVEIIQEKDHNNVLVPLIDFYFSIPRGTRFYSGKGTYLTDSETNEEKLISIPLDDNIELHEGDYFLEGETSKKIGMIYQYTKSNDTFYWKYITSILGETPIISAESEIVNPDKDLKIEVYYEDSDIGRNYPLLHFEIPRGTKIFTQSIEPELGTDSPDKAAENDYWFNLIDGDIYQYKDGNWISIGTFIINLTNTTTIGIDPYVVDSNGLLSLSNPEFLIEIDENNPAAKPKVTAKLPRAPKLTVNETVEVLAPNKRGEASFSYSNTGCELKLKLPQGIQGEIGKGLNIRRSYNSIADRDLNAEGLIWKDADACTVRKSQEGNNIYYDIYVYQNDYLGKWVYTGTLLASIVNDTSVDLNNSWSSEKINQELQSLEDKLQNKIQETTETLNNLISQNITQQLENLNNKIAQLENNYATKEELSNLQQSLIIYLGNSITENAEMITKIVRELGKPWSWSDLRNGKRIALSRSMMANLSEEDKLLFEEEDDNELS